MAWELRVPSKFGSAKIVQGSVLEILPALIKVLGEQSFDALLSDPPYEIGCDTTPSKTREEVSSGWDSTGVAFNIGLWTAARRLLRPGAYAMTFGATRRYHRMACAIEDAGLEIVDGMAWMFGVGQSMIAPIPEPGWEGHRPRLRPGYEPIVLSRRRPEGTVVANVREHGVGGLAVDACKWGEKNRLPTNMMLDADAATVLDELNPGSSRFFCCHKVTEAERNFGLPERSPHPTPKPVEMCAYLARLLLPAYTGRPRRLLVPFSGSGSEVIGGLLSGWEEVIGVEMSAEYAGVARARISAYGALCSTDAGRIVSEVVTEKAPKRKKAKEAEEC